MTRNTPSHIHIPYLYRYVHLFNLPVTDGTAQSRPHVKHVRKQNMSREVVNPLPNYRLSALPILVYFLDLRAVRPHELMARHAEFYLGKTRRYRTLGKLMTVRTFETDLLYMDFM